MVTYLNEKVRSFNIEHKRLVEGFFCRALEIVHGGTSSVGHDAVNFAKLVHRCLDELLNIRNTGYVGFYGQRSIRSNLVDHLICWGAVTGVVYDDTGAVGCDTLDNGFADTFRATCDKDDFPFERHVVGLEIST